MCGHKSQAACVTSSQGNPMAATALRPKAYPGVQLLAAASIEANSVEQALRGAQFRFDRALHDLRSEFIVRENKLRDEYLAEVAENHGGQRRINRLPWPVQAPGKQLTR